MARYQSETTNFFQQLKEKNPNLESEQIQGHNLLREKPLDLKKIEEINNSIIAQKPYVYGSE